MTDQETEMPADERRRRLEQLRREQGVQPVKDPAELHGPEVSEEEFQAFHEAAMSARVRPTT